MNEVQLALEHETPALVEPPSVGAGDSELGLPPGVQELIGRSLDYRFQGGLSGEHSRSGWLLGPPWIHGEKKNKI